MKDDSQPDICLGALRSGLAVVWVLLVLAFLGWAIQHRMWSTIGPVIGVIAATVVFASVLAFLMAVIIWDLSQQEEGGHFPDDEIP